MPTKLKYNKEIDKRYDNLYQEWKEAPLEDGGWRVCDLDCTRCMFEIQKKRWWMIFGEWSFPMNDDGSGTCPRCDARLRRDEDGKPIVKQLKEKLITRRER